MTSVPPYDKLAAVNSPDLRRPAHHPNTVYRVFGDEAVVISPTENVVRMLNSTASHIWELADGSRTADEIVNDLTLEFAVDDATAHASVTSFLGEMMDKGLLVWSTD